MFPISSTFAAMIVPKRLPSSREDMLARESAGTAPDDLTMLRALELPTAADPLLLRRARELAIELKRHLFDALYHAAAPGSADPDTTLNTSGVRHLRAARHEGRIIDLMEWE
jgi:hypothetical protein